METWFEIFKTGIHTDSGGTTKEWTEDDLDAIVASYNISEHEAPIVIGHPEGTAPAYGWISALKREGGRLLARAKQIMPEFAELVHAGRYKKVSIGLADGNRLHHVGFLGAIAPAIPGLADARFSEGCPLDEIITDSGAGSEEEAETTQPKTELPDPVMAQFSNFEQRLLAMENNIAGLLKSFEPDKPAVPVQSANDEALDSLLGSAIVSGKITPAQKSIALQMFGLLTADNGTEISTGGAPVQSLQSLFKQFIDLQQAHTLFSEMPKPEKTDIAVPASDFERLRGLIQKTMTTIE